MSLGILGCKKQTLTQKTSTIENVKSNNEPVNLKTEIVIGYYFTWDDWGRKESDCRSGRGLCNFRLEEIRIDIGFGGACPINTDNNGNMWVDIAITPDMPVENDNDNFWIDEDINYTMPNEDVYTVFAGSYQKINSIGDEGGYRIPLSKL